MELVDYEIASNSIFEGVELTTVIHVLEALEKRGFCSILRSETSEKKGKETQKGEIHAVKFIKC